MVFAEQYYDVVVLKAHNGLQCREKIFGGNFRLRIETSLALLVCGLGLNCFYLY
jgi:hypothetical protein